MAVRRDPATGEYVGLVCDTCDNAAPTSAEIIEGHGLINMGWSCVGGTHICPACPHPSREATVREPLSRTVTS